MGPNITLMGMLKGTGIVIIQLILLRNIDTGNLRIGLSNVSIIEDKVKVISSPHPQGLVLQKVIQKKKLLMLLQKRRKPKRPRKLS